MWSRAKTLMVRGVASAAVAMLGAGCGGDTPSTTGTAVVSDPSTPVTPVPNRPPSPTPGSYAITGLVREAGRPIAGVNVNAWVAEDGGFGYSWWWAHGQLHADAAGRYSISGLPSGVHVWLQAFQDGYDQQCAVSVPTLRGDTTVDIALVSRAVVAPTACLRPACGRSPVRSCWGPRVASNRQPERSSTSSRSWTSRRPLRTLTAQDDSRCAGCPSTTRSGSAHRPARTSGTRRCRLVSQKA